MQPFWSSSTGSVGTGYDPETPLLTYTRTSFRPPPLASTVCRSRPCGCIAWHLGSAEVLIFSGAGAVPSKLILPEMEAAPVVAPPPADAAGAAADAAGAGGGAASSLAPPPQARRGRPTRAITARDDRMDIAC